MMLTSMGHKQISVKYLASLSLWTKLKLKLVIKLGYNLILIQIAKVWVKSKIQSIDNIFSAWTKTKGDILAIVAKFLMALK